MAADTSAGPKGALSRKLGPLPAWAWVSIAGTLIVIWALWQRAKSNSSSTTTAGNVTPPVIDQFQLTTPPVADQDTGGQDTDTGTGGGSQPPPGKKPPPKPRPRKPPHGGHGHDHGHRGGHQMTPPHIVKGGIPGKIFRPKGGALTGKGRAA